MFTLLILTAFMFLQLIAEVSPQLVISYIIGALVTVGATAAVKNLAKTKGLIATLISYAIAFVVAVFGFLVSQYLAGGDISVESVFKASSQIFTLSQIAYRALAPLVADNSSGNGGDTPSDGNATAPAF